MKYTLSIIVAFLFGASLVSVLHLSVPWHHSLANLSQSPQTVPSPLQKCVGIYVYDGDTFACDFNGNGRIDGQIEHVRLVGVNASEMHYSQKNHTGQDEPFAAEAKQFVSDRIMHKTLYLSYDVIQIDKYGRTLAYVYLDPQQKQMLNALLLQAGFAKLFLIGRNRRYESEFTTLAEAAQQQHLRLWSITSQ